MTSSSNQTADDALPNGQLVGERYRIEGLLGEGGVGRVYRARHTTLGRSVALKVLLAEHVRSAVLRERFRREAETLAGLSHPHIVSVTDFGVDGEMLFLVMELLEGRTLAELLRDGPIEPARGLAIVRQVLLALGYAHARGIVHRDLKPHNVFVRRLDDGRDHVTVLDFGLARVIDAGRPAAQLTRAGALIGTPAYMAPEQASGDVQSIDKRTDVYAAGLLLYEVLCRRRPFTSTDASALLRAHLLEEPPPLTQADPSLRVSAELQALVSRALAKSRTQRFADATEMLAALDALHGDAARREAPGPGDPATLAIDDPGAFVSAATLAASPVARAAGAPGVVLGGPAPGLALGAAPASIGAASIGAASMAAASMGAPGIGAPSMAAAGVGAPSIGAPSIGVGAASGAAASVVVAPAPPSRSRLPLVLGAVAVLTLATLSVVVIAIVWIASAPASPDPAPSAGAPPVPLPPAPVPVPPPSPATPAARDPFAEPLPEPMARLHAQVQRGGSLSRSQVRDVRAWAREHGGDVRGNLLLAHSYTNERALSYALPEYDEAMAHDPTVRGDPEMLPDLIEMASSGALAREASERIAEWYGSEALDEVEAALAATERREERRRLEALRDRLAR